MTFNFTTGLVSRYFNGELGVLINIPNVSEETLLELSKLMEDEKLKTVEIKYKKDKRSLDSNAYCWKIMSEIAKKLTTTDEEVYLNMLHKYGMRDFVGALPQAEETLKRVYKIVEVVKDCEINGKPAKTFKLIRGSSQYDSKEMSDFIKGVVEEAKGLGIETMTPDEIAEMNARWNI